jgi:hypothetical protein
MANLKLKKTDLKGPVSVGSGWLVTRGWCTQVGDDKRLTNLTALNAGFANLDSAALTIGTLDQIKQMHRVPALGEGYQRTRVLLEGEDGALLRIYRNPDANGPARICLSEAVLGILGNPPNVERVPGYSNTYTCAAGLIASTTDSPPEWAKELE